MNIPQGQMKNVLLQKLSSFSLARPSGRKLVLGVLGVVIVIYLIIPLLKSGSHRYMVLTRIERCLQDRLKIYNTKVNSQNSFVYHVPTSDKAKPVEKYFLPYIGNGYIGISLDGKHGVWLKGERGLDIATDYNPLVSFEISGYDVKEAFVLDIVDGKIVKHTCYQQHGAVGILLI
ncbi:hypothetical protein EB796_003451 [Bugula neritina]|uniref:Uncharacterized protein n=1 Tax=Bugula neritina TaxID=10212 RepID=A0A7J7KKS0_BUGNE|nr:hypothetical protein EB796_003451 [Bugula neritina]